MKGWVHGQGYPGVPAATSIKRKFDVYRVAIMPPKAPEIQVRECDLAFHAGAEAMFDLMTNEAPESEADAMKFMASLKNELLARAQRYVKTGT